MEDSKAKITQLVTVPELADAWQLSERTIIRMINEGHLKIVRVGCKRGNIRITHAAIEEYLERCAEGGLSEGEGVVEVGQVDLEEGDGPDYYYEEEEEEEEEDEHVDG